MIESFSFRNGSDFENLDNYISTYHRPNDVVDNSFFTSLTYGYSFDCDWFTIHCDYYATGGTCNFYQPIIDYRGQPLTYNDYTHVVQISNFYYTSTNVKFDVTFNKSYDINDFDINVGFGFDIIMGSYYLQGFLYNIPFLQLANDVYFTTFNIDTVDTISSFDNSYTLKATSNANWNLISVPSWITPSTSLGLSGETNINFNVTKATTINTGVTNINRQCDIKFNYKNRASNNYTIGHYYQYDLIFTYAAATQMINLMTGKTWSIIGNSTWFTSQIINNILLINVNENIFDERNGILTLKCDNSIMVVNIKQYYNIYSRVYNITFNKTGDTYIQNLLPSNYNWIISNSGNSWLTSQIVNNKLTISAGNNTLGGRTTKIIVKYLNYYMTYNIIQNGSQTNSFYISYANDGINKYDRYYDGNNAGTYSYLLNYVAGDPLPYVIPKYVGDYANGKTINVFRVKIPYHCTGFTYHIYSNLEWTHYCGAYTSDDGFWQQSIIDSTIYSGTSIAYKKNNNVISVKQNKYLVDIISPCYRAIEYRINTLATNSICEFVQLGLPRITLNNNSYNVPFLSGSTFVVFNTRYNCTIISNQTWCKIKNLIIYPAWNIDDFSYRFYIEYDENATGLDRTAIITINDTYNPKTITVTQDTKFITSINTTSDAILKTVEIISPNWYVETHPEWCSVTKSDNLMNINFTENTQLTSRTGDIEYYVDDYYYETFKITQSGHVPYITLSKYTINETCNTFTEVISVESNTNWFILEDVSWCTPTIIGNTISINCSINYSDSQRTGVIKIYITETIYKLLTITQDAYDDYLMC